MCSCTYICVRVHTYIYARQMSNAIQMLITNDNDKIISDGVKSLLGYVNDYLVMLLKDYLCGNKRVKYRLMISRLFCCTKHNSVKTKLQQDIEVAQDNVVNMINKLTPYDEKKIHAWILNVIMFEKLRDRETTESADYWKYINGTLAIVIPVVVYLLEHYVKGCVECSCNSSE
jgi:hypothetical protein